MFDARDQIRLRSNLFFGPGKLGAQLLEPLRILTILCCPVVCLPIIAQ